MFNLNVWLEKRGLSLATCPSEDKSLPNVDPDTKSPFSTCTKSNKSEAVVPWLAANGALSYTPEKPPEDHDLFDYSKIFPASFQIRKPYFLGAQPSSGILLIASFWESTYARNVERVHIENGRTSELGYFAPIAVYRFQYCGENCYLFIQQGNYLGLSCELQPEVESGYVYLYRGIGKRPFYRHFQESLQDFSNSDIDQLKAYFCSQANSFTDSTRTFNLAHEHVYRGQTNHLKSRINYFQDVLDSAFDSDTWLRGMFLGAVRSSFTLQSFIAKNNFGPNWICVRTPITNIRLSSFFTWESEVRVIDPFKLELVEASGCNVVHNFIEDPIWVQLELKSIEEMDGPSPKSCEG